MIYKKIRMGILKKNNNNKNKTIKFIIEQDYTLYSSYIIIIILKENSPHQNNFQKTPTNKMILI